MIAKPYFSCCEKKLADILAYILVDMRYCILCIYCALQRQNDN